MKAWHTDKIPNLAQKVAIITGGNTGLGFQISLELARKNAKIIIACRSREKGLKAIQDIEQILKREIQSEVIPLDLTDKQSIREFAETFLRKHHNLDLLINNAGVVSLKQRQESKDGTEMHMATNHFGHFALTGLLLEAIKRTANARVVTMSSGAYLSGEIDFNDIHWKQRVYRRMKCYGDSKFANLLFMIELDRLFKQHHCSAISVGAHPGLSASKGQQERAEGLFFKTMAQSVEMGALPALMAATDPNVTGESYYGPKWGLRGAPKKAKLRSKVFDKALAQKLWQYSETHTQVKYQF